MSSRDFGICRLLDAVMGETRAPGERRLGRSVLLGASGTLALNVFSLCLNFVLALVLARSLGSSGYGAYAFAVAWASVLSVPAALGLTPLVVRYIAAYTESGSWTLVRGLIRITNQMVGASSALVVIGASTIGWLLLRDSGSDLLEPYLIGLILVPLIALTALRQAALQGLNHVILSRLPEAIVMSAVFLLLVSVARWLMGEQFSAEWAVGLNIIAAATAFALGVTLLRSLLPASIRTADTEHNLREWIREGAPLLVLATLNTLSGQAGIILVGAISGSESAGTYGVAARIALFTGFLFLAATYPLYPSVARLWAIGDVGSLQRLLTQASRVVLIASCGIGVILLVLAPYLLDIFGPQFGSGTTALRILVLGQLLGIAAGFGGLALVMTPHAGGMTLSVGCGLVLNVVMGVALIPTWGASGAAVAAAAGQSLTGALGAWLAWRRLGVFSPAVGRPRATSKRLG